MARACRGGVFGATWRWVGGVEGAPAAEARAGGANEEERRKAAGRFSRRFEGSRQKNSYGGILSLERACQQPNLLEHLVLSAFMSRGEWISSSLHLPKG